MKVAILSDIHSNLEALDACLAHADAQGAARFVCLGDLIGYGADPAPVLERVMELPGLVAVRGNHDEALLRAEGTQASGGIGGALAWTRRQLSDTQRAFLEQLPYQRTEGQVSYVHASAHAPHEWDYIYGEAAAAECLAAAATPVVFIGHTHLPRLFYATHAGVLRELIPTPGVALPLSGGSRYVVSAGSVGQPRDGNPSACYVLYDEERQCVTFFRVSYDHERTARKIVAAGLDPFFASRLARGR